MRITGIKTTPVAVPLNINTTDAYLRKGPAVLIEAILEVFTDEGIPVLLKFRSLLERQWLPILLRARKAL